MIKYGMVWSLCEVVKPWSHQRFTLWSAQVMPSFSSEGITVPSRRKQRGTSFSTSVEYSGDSTCCICCVSAMICRRCVSKLNWIQSRSVAAALAVVKESKSAYAYMCLWRMVACLVIWWLFVFCTCPAADCFPSPHRMCEPTHAV